MVVEKDTEKKTICHFYRGGSSPCPMLHASYVIVFVSYNKVICVKFTLMFSLKNNLTTCGYQNRYLVDRIGLQQLANCTKISNLL